MSYAVTDAGEDDMRAELKVLDQLTEDIDQLSATARDCGTLAPEVKTLLDLAWYFTEKALREANGHCSAHAKRGYCACCAHFSSLELKAQVVERTI